MLAAIILSVAACWYLVGLTWVVALLVYPAFSFVGANEWPAYHEAPRRRIAIAVGPMWFLQAVGLAAWLISPPSRSWAWAIASAALATAAVVITLLGAVPAHEAMADGCDPVLLRRLLRWHWLRTLIWTACALIATGGLVEVVRS